MERLVCRFLSGELGEGDRDVVIRLIPEVPVRSRSESESTMVSLLQEGVLRGLEVLGCCVHV